MGDKPIEGPCWAQIRLPVEGLFVVAGDGRFVKRSFAHSEEPLIDFAKRPAKKKKKVLRMLVKKEEKKILPLKRLLGIRREVSAVSASALNGQVGLVSKEY